MNKKLEQEAKDFMAKKATPKQKKPDRDAFRFYMGSALSGLIAVNVLRADDVIDEAVKWAELCIKKEKEVLG